MEIICKLIYLKPNLYIMKKVLLFASIVAAVSMTSCGGWNDDNKKELKDNCVGIEEILYEKDEAGKICDCMVGKLVAKFPKADQTQADVANTLEECAKESGFKDKLTKSFEKSLGDFNDSLDQAMSGFESSPAIN